MHACYGSTFWRCLDKTLLTSKIPTTLFWGKTFPLEWKFASSQAMTLRTIPKQNICIVVVCVPFYAFISSLPPFFAYETKRRVGGIQSISQDARRPKTQFSCLRKLSHFLKPWTLFSILKYMGRWVIQIRVEKGAAIWVQQEETSLRKAVALKRGGSLKIYRQIFCHSAIFLHILLLLPWNHCNAPIQNCT